jgi:hypothetical protein
MLPLFDLKSFNEFKSKLKRTLAHVSLGELLFISFLPLKEFASFSWWWPKSLLDVLVGRF